MIAQEYRFHGYGGVRAIQRQGKSVREPFLTVKYLTDRPENRRPRLAVVVAKKVSKSAPRRNRIRRRLYEVLRLHLDEIKGGSDIVLSAFDTGLATLPHDKLEQHVMELLKKAGLV